MWSNNCSTLKCSWRGATNPATGPTAGARSSLQNAKTLSYRRSPCRRSTSLQQSILLPRARVLSASKVSYKIAMESKIQEISMHAGRASLISNQLFSELGFSSREVYAQGTCKSVLFVGSAMSSGRAGIRSLMVTSVSTWRHSSSRKEGSPSAEHESGRNIW